MKTFIQIITLFILQSSLLFAGNENEKSLKQKQCFFDVRTELESMLAGEIPLDYERAVFICENAYWNNRITYSAYKEYIDFHTERIKNIIENNKNQIPDIKWNILYNENQQKEKYQKLLCNWAIYKYLTDTCLFVDSNSFYYHLPYNYSSDDPFGTNNWKNTQTINLLINKKGNCYALAALYKIFSERLNSDANLGLAPGHIFINHNDLNDRNYNIELASQSFPGAGSIMTLTYSPTEAVRNGIAMRTLDLKQSVALCLVYLAKGYEHKFNTKTDNFILQCAATTQQYDSLNLNAMLLKAEVLEKRIIDKNKSIALLQKDHDFKEYEKLIAALYVKGYREMPLDMKNIIINKLQNDSSGLILTDHTPKGFQNIKPKDDRYATLSWGMFDEIHETKLIERYNNTLYNTRTGKIVKFVTSNTLYNKYLIDAAVFAWQIDPLAAKYPMMSPYVAFKDNPIYYIDPDGRDGIGYLTELNGEKTLIIKSNYYTTMIISEQTANKVNQNLNACSNQKIYYNGEKVNVKFEVEFIWKDVKSMQDINTKNNRTGFNEGENIFAYQKFEDKDQLGGGNRMGVYIDKNKIGFGETLYNYEAAVITEEIGHNLGFMHSDGGIMQEEFNKDNPVSKMSTFAIQRFVNRLSDMSKSISSKDYWTNQKEEVVSKDETNSGITKINEKYNSNEK